MDVVQTSLSLFAPPPTDKSIVKEYWVDYSPIAAISEGGVIEFSVPGTSVDYISLGKSKLHIKYIITDEEGDKITDERDIHGVPTANNHQVAPVKNYKLKIISAVWKICYISLYPNMILAHDEALKISPAIYPFWRSDLRSFSVAKGALNFMTDNIYHGKVPSKLVIGMISNAGYSGDYDKNPFDFKHMNLNYLEVTVDGQPVPNRALTPNFEKGDFVSSYLSLLDNNYDRKNGIIIKLLEYHKGYTLFLFDIQSFLSGHIMSKSIKGHIRLTMRFAKALTETINIIIYGKFPESLSIDHSRNVSLGS